ncbi:acetate--CoA ligase family protein [Dankookia sp. P2]|uniref:acetate--CoA ligase family protein n=1 Tax=Dankookia sp. P2 TaxID=3423955 RepID=UPI003D66A3E6
MNVARVVDFLVDDPATKVIGLFLETVHDAALLAAAARRALAADKPIVAIKIGASETAARAAEAHTGSLVGDDRVFDAVCRQLGIIRVASIEDLVFTAALLARLGHVRDRRLGLVSISGGVCEMAADQAEHAGVAVPRLAPETRDALRQILPAFGTPNNPLDVTGGAMLDASLFARSLPVFGADPSIGLVACFMDVPDTPEEIAGYRGGIVRQIGEGFRASACASVMLSVLSRPVTEAGRVLLEETGITYLGSGVQHGLGAIGRAFAWAERQERGVPALAAPPVPATERPASEHATLALLGSRGVPVVPLTLARNAAEAVAAAASLGGPAVLKVASPDIAHKSDIGGVLLNLKGPEAVAAGFDRIMASVRAAKPDAAIDGVLVGPMRTGGGVELFVGVLRDPLWGPAIAVGLGGIWVEALRDTAIRLLPVSPAEVLEMFAELRGTKLLDGYRGTPGIDRAAAAAAVARIGDAALALGPALASLEVNPLRATATGAEALDALAIWNEDC